MQSGRDRLPAIAGSLHIVREFAAPRHLVYKAWTTPELIRRWWHANRGQVTLADVDLPVGGTWRWISVTDGGFEVAFHGEYREVIANERIVFTEVFEGIPGGDDAPAVNTLTFTEKDGRTTLTLLTQVTSQEIRDAIIASGMEAGMQAAWDLLEQVAISLTRCEAVVRSCEGLGSLVLVFKDAHGLQPGRLRARVAINLHA